MKNKSVLVTGSEGFIGSHLVEQLLAHNFKVKALVQYNSYGDLGWLGVIEDRNNLEILFGDIRDAEFMADSLAGCTCVLNLAALIGIPYSYSNPRAYFETNVLGILNICEAVRRMEQPPRVVQASTSEVYGSAQSSLISENHAKVAQSPYAASKIAGDKVIESFHCSFDLDVCVIRPFNTYGPRQSRRAFIPAVVYQMLFGDTVRVGSLDPRRDLTFVTDTAAGFLKAVVAGPSIAGCEINLGTGIDYSMGEVLQILKDLTNFSGNIEVDANRVRPNRSEVQRLTSDNSKAQNILGWTPSLDLKKGLEETVIWMEKQGPNPARSSSAYLI